MISETPAPVPLYILAGGHSSRFGSDKALADLDGRPLIVYVAEQFQPWVSEVIVVADRVGKYEAVGFRTITDRTPHLGPMGGLLAALNDCCVQWLLVAACDAIVLHSASIERLMRESRSDCQAIAFKGTRWEPLPALFHASLLTAVNNRLEGEFRSLARLIDQVPNRGIPTDSAGPFISQINTRADLQQFKHSQIKLR